MTISGYFSFETEAFSRLNKHIPLNEENKRKKACYSMQYYCHKTLNKCSSDNFHDLQSLTVKASPSNLQNAHPKESGELFTAN